MATSSLFKRALIPAALALGVSGTSYAADFTINLDSAGAPGGSAGRMLNITDVGFDALYHVVGDVVDGVASDGEGFTVTNLGKVTTMAPVSGEVSTGTSPWALHDNPLAPIPGAVGEVEITFRAVTRHTRGTAFVDPGTGAILQSFSNDGGVVEFYVDFDPSDDPSPATTACPAGGGLVGGGACLDIAHSNGNAADGGTGFTPFDDPTAVLLAVFEIIPAGVGGEANVTTFDGNQSTMFRLVENTLGALEINCAADETGCEVAEEGEIVFDLSSTLDADPEGSGATGPDMLLSGEFASGTGAGCADLTGGLIPSGPDPTDPAFATADDFCGFQDGTARVVEVPAPGPLALLGLGLLVTLVGRKLKG